MGLQYEKITEQIIGAAFEVHGMLGYGFLEKVYQRAMQAELSRRGLKAELEHKITVYYKNVAVGDYQADLFVEEAVIVELKATGVKVGLLINFGRTKVEFKRMVF